MRRILDGGGAGGGVSTWLLAFEWGGGLGGTRGEDQGALGFGYNFKGLLVKQLFKGGDLNTQWICINSSNSSSPYKLLRTFSFASTRSLHSKEVEGITFCLSYPASWPTWARKFCSLSFNQTSTTDAWTYVPLTNICMRSCVFLFSNIFSFINWAKESWSLFFLLELQWSQWPFLLCSGQK